MSALTSSKARKGTAYVCVNTGPPHRCSYCFEASCLSSRYNPESPETAHGMS